MDAFVAVLKGFRSLLAAVACLACVTLNFSVVILFSFCKTDVK
jgi:hypothetical protein